MAGYIGQPAVYGRFRKLDSIAASFNGVTTSFALTIGSVSYIPSNALQLLVVVNGVVKEPGVDYTVNGSNLVFAVAPTGGQSFHAVLYGDTGFLPVAGTASYVTEAAQPNITSVGTLTTLEVSGTVTASKFTSNVATGTAPLTVSSTTQVANLNVAVAGTVATAAQPNITSVGNLTIANVDNIQIDGNTISTTNTNGNLNVTMNGTGQLVVDDVVNATRFVSNITTGTAPLTVTSTTQVANLNVALAGTVTTAAQPNITSVGNLTIANIDNIQLDSNTISTTNTNGNLVLTPNGTGVVTASYSIASTDDTATLATTAWIRDYGGFQGMTVLTSGSGLTGNVPTGINKIKVTVIGGGGAGGGNPATVGVAGSGGGAGGMGIKYYTGVAGLQYTYTVGGGGTGASNAVGGNGSDSTFLLNGVTVTAKGGTGGPVGIAATNTVGGAGGVAGTGGDINIPGAPGAAANYHSATAGQSSSGNGGPSHLGGGALGVRSAAVGSLAGNNGVANTGGGGSGSVGGAATATVGTGGNGGSGIIIIEY